MFQLNISGNRKTFIKSQKQNYERISNIVLITIVAITIFVGITLMWNLLNGHKKVSIPHYNRKKHTDMSQARESISGENDESQPWNPNCSYWDCFNVYRCGQKEQGRMNIFVYPFKEYLDTGSGKQSTILTKEYYRILETVMQSDYFTPNPNEACLFLPSMDLLNENLIDTKHVGKALISLDYWDNGENHLIFNILPGSAPTFNRVLNVSTDKAIILGGGFDSLTYRSGFDIAFPVWSPLLEFFDSSNMGKQQTQPRKYLLISAQRKIIPEHQNLIRNLANDYHTDVLVLEPCKHSTSDEKSSSKNKVIRCDILPKYTRHEYPHVLSKGIFCLMGRSMKMGQPIFLEMIAYKCIPVVVSDNIILPFEDVIDWSLATIRIREPDMHSIMQKLRAISQYKIQEMQQQCEWLFQKYFKDLPTITLTALEILNGRIFPHLAKTNLQWNTIDTNCRSAHNPLFQPLISVNSQGFTAVILTYDRVESLFTLIQKLSVVSSLQSILVIWNNQRKAPPQLSMFPKILKPLKVIQTNANKLSNRFYPYDEIETEAILTIDDDIVMLTADELNFGFEVWREFPDRIVGFPSRIHIWDNATMSWHYESEWTNQISMVLTGAAFHHKYWSYMYTNAMPVEIKDWVDEHMNCEDIAMNFLVANITNKPPIKVAPRKKFKCPECTNTEMLSAYLNHMMERSTCIDRFAQFYGHMPLRSVEFRADPVLYKDNFPEKLKRFNEIGSL